MRRSLSWDLEPADALRLVRGDPHPVALIGAWAGGGAVIGSEPCLTRSPPQDLADVLDSPAPVTERSVGGGFGGGWIGYLGYGLAGDLMDIPPAPGGPRRLPAWWFGYYDHVLRQDGTSGEWFFEALWTPDRAEALERRFDELTGRSRSVPEPRAYACGDFGLVPSAAEHMKAVRRTVELIRQGDVFQANICLRLEAAFRGDPLDLFCRGVSQLHPPYAAFARLPGGDLASLSPELFLRRTGRTAASRPIKGTRRRSPLEGRAAAQRRELEHSAKDRAENVMIVDLVRNDLSRACVPGSVQVPRLLRAEAHPGVWHLVSDVRGTLGADSGDGDLVRGAFPPGSVTGAPKIRAMEIIHELEATPREVYTGAVGYRSPVAGLELNVAIRTFEFRGDHVWLGAGGGIVADSRDDDEFSECLLKAAPLIRAVGGRLAGERRAGAARRPRGRGDAPALGPPGTTTLQSLNAEQVPRTSAARQVAPPPIVMIDNYDSFTYNLVHMLVVAGCRVEVVRNDEVTAAQVAAFGPAGIVISPGPCGPAEAGISVDVVRACGAATQLLGVCLGHQAVAAAFGARIVRAPQPVHGRTSAIAHDGRALFSGVPQRFEATRYHSLIVDEASLPASLRVTARTRDGLPMALRHATQPVEGVQFHPESILTMHGPRIMWNFAQAVGRWRESGTTEASPAACP
ncbi:MAG TPA: aminodeoxychorismate synthase component I [Streptosporangiaceae bacterium]|nr:aminodeoxychorismate synthase component I [Streptosporangiaceae bacterium]